MAPAISLCRIADGATVDYRVVNLQVVASGATEISFSNDGSLWSAWADYDGQYYEWTIGPGDGAHVVSVKVQDGSSAQATASATVTLATEDSTLELLDKLPAISSRDPLSLLYSLFGAVAS